MLTLFAKELILDTKLFCLIVVNMILVDFISNESVINKTQTYFYMASNLSIPYFDESIIVSLTQIQRPYMFAMLGFVAATIQNKFLHSNLMKMLVTKINLLQTSLDIKDIYNASMIHELRNPLNAILGSIGLLKYSQSLKKDDMETLNIASVSGEILITLINNALDGAKLEANRLELDPHMIDIVEILTKSVSLFQWKAKEKRINISLKIAKKIPDQVDIDEARLVQILVNIIGNAVKFTPNNGKVKVRANFISDYELTNSENLFVSRMNKSNDLFSDEENEEEYEEQYFYNKDLIVDIQASDEIERKQDSTSRVGLQIHDYDIDSALDKSAGEIKVAYYGPSQTTPNNLGTPGLPNEGRMESFTSLYNIGSLEEKNIGSKISFVERDLIIKNSFHEWIHSPIGKMPLREPLVSFPQTTRLPTFQHIEEHKKIDPSPKNNSSSHLLVVGSHLNSKNIVDSNYYRDSQKAYSESLNRDSSLLLDSQYFDKPNSNPNSNSGHITFRKKNEAIKSTFFGQDYQNIDESESCQDPNLSPEDPHRLNKSETINDQHANMFSFQQVRQSCKGKLVIEIIDNGIGMSQEGIKKLFQPFAQADKSIQAKYGGTGLGLWISHKLVNLMRGKIKVSSEINKGTVFAIEIPVNSLFPMMPSQSSDPNKLFFQESPNSSSFRTHKQTTLHQQIASRNSGTIGMNDIKVLLYKHDDIMKNLFKKYLERNKVQFKFVTNFKELLRCFKSRQFKAVFIDIDTNVKGDELEKLITLHQKLRYDDENFRSLIYCAFSRDFEKTKTRFMQRNNINILKKPIQGYQLSKILKKIKENTCVIEDPLQMRSHQQQELHMMEDIQQKSSQHPHGKTEQKPQLNDRIELNARENSSLKQQVNSFDKEQISIPMLKLTQELKIEDEDSNDLTKKIEQEEEKLHNFLNNIETNQIVDMNLESLLNNPNTPPRSFVPKINRQIQKIKDDEKKASSPSHDTPRKRFSGVKIDLGSFSKAAETVKQTQSSTFKLFDQQQQTSVGLVRNISIFEEEEEKRIFQLNTPQFNRSQNNSSRPNSHAENSHDERSPSFRLGSFDHITTNNRLCMTIQPSGAVAAPQIFSEVFPPKKSNMAILIVDDNRMNSFIVQKILEKDKIVSGNNIELIIADNGEEAVKSYTQHFNSNTNKIKLILMDCNMPILDGYDASKKIREHEILNNCEDTTLIIGLSGNQGELHVRKCRMSGMNDSITKPIVLEQLKDIVKKAFKPLSGSPPNGRKLKQLSHQLL